MLGNAAFAAAAICDLTGWSILGKYELDALLLAEARQARPLIGQEQRGARVGWGAGMHHQEKKTEHR